MKRIIIYGVLTFLSFAFAIPSLIYCCPFFKMVEEYDKDLACNVAAFGFVTCFLSFAFNLLFDFFDEIRYYFKNKKSEKTVEKAIDLVD